MIHTGQLPSMDYRRLDENMCEETPEGVVTRLRTHQRIFVQWAQDRSCILLGDEMGLGKSLEVLALCAKDPGPTLIVTPLSVMAEWQSQIATHLDSSFNYHTWHGSGRNVEPEVLRRSHFVLTTYDAVRDSLALAAVRWHRVVLDEAHVMRNHKSRLSCSIRKIKSAKKVALTGTPVHNRLCDLMSIMQWFGCSEIGGNPEDAKAVAASWRAACSRAGSECLALSKVLERVFIRRLKKDVEALFERGSDNHIPDMVFDDVILHAPPAYQTQYRELHTAALTTLDAVGNSSTYMHVFKCLSSMRQHCVHPHLVKVHSPRCAWCAAGAPATEPAHMMSCGHLVCDGCVTKRQSASRLGTVCTFEGCDGIIEWGTSRPATKYDFLTALEDQGILEETLAPPDAPSPKMDDFVSTVRALSGDDKMLVFSQWTSALDLCEARLRNMKLGYTRLDGSMPLTKRNEAKECFATDASIRVFLISIGSGGEGLNLVAANKVYLLEPNWNPQKEAQAFQRCHRMGQTRQVTVRRVYMHGTIEDRMVDLQRQKGHLADTLLDGVPQSQAQVNEIHKLLGGATSKRGIETPAEIQRAHKRRRVPSA